MHIIPAPNKYSVWCGIVSHSAIKEGHPGPMAALGYMRVRGKIRRTQPSHHKGGWRAPQPGLRVTFTSVLLGSLGLPTGSCAF